MQPSPAAPASTSSVQVEQQQLKGEQQQQKQEQQKEQQQAHAAQQTEQNTGMQNGSQAAADSAKRDEEWRSRRSLTWGHVPGSGAVLENPLVWIDVEMTGLHLQQVGVCCTHRFFVHGALIVACSLISSYYHGSDSHRTCPCAYCLRVCITHKHCSMLQCFASLVACLQDNILEIAVVITDGSLETVIKGPCIAIHQEPSQLANINKWSKDMHQQTGLLERVANSKSSTADAEAAVLEWVRRYLQPRCANLAGSSVYVGEC